MEYLDLLLWLIPQAYVIYAGIKGGKNRSTAIAFIWSTLALSLNVLHNSPDVRTIAWIFLIGSLIFLWEQCGYRIRKNLLRLGILKRRRDKVWPPTILSA
jgi:hypothetical protein